MRTGKYAPNDPSSKDLKFKDQKLLLVEKMGQINDHTHDLLKYKRLNEKQKLAY